MPVSWLKDNDVRESLVITDSWNTNSTFARTNRSLIVNGKKIKNGSYLANVQSIRIPVKVMVTELEDQSRAILLCYDTALSSEMIIQYDSLRRLMETFFKFVKQNLLARCQIRSEAGPTHYLIVIAIICQIFNDRMEILQAHQKRLRYGTHSVYFVLLYHICL